MATQIPSVRNYIYVEGSQFRSAVSEELIQRIGGSINWVLDNYSTLKTAVFTTNGTWVAPTGVTRVLAFGCGGGGGGAGAIGATASTRVYRGGGGAFPQAVPVTVAGGTSYAITIGTGGSGGAGVGNALANPGSDGGSTTFAGVTFFGGRGGQGDYGVQDSTGVGGGGSGGAAAVYSVTSGGLTVRARDGQRSILAAGGVGGIQNTREAGSGGGAGYGAGGNGGDGATVNGNGGNGQAASGIGGGGGAGGCGDNVAGRVGGSGGAGGPGILILAWVELA